VPGRVVVSLEPERRSHAPSADGASAVPVDTSIARVVVLGNGIAGVTAADHIRRHHRTCEIHLVGRERHPLYNRMAISRLVYGRSAMQGLYLLPEAWYDEHQITCWLNTLVLRIEPEARLVLLGTGDVLPYDRLILAMGSSGFVPPVEGYGLPGTFLLREADDAMHVRAFSQQHNCRQAVIAGGGLLGIEAGYALHKLGLEVSILERGDWLLRRQLDERAADYLRGYLEGLGLNIVLRAETAAVEGSGRVERVVLKDGRMLPAELFLACVGIAPNVTLAEEAGLAVNRGVIVDEHMRTSEPEVFAVGDVAEFRGDVPGLWPTAVAQAEVAAINVVGGDRVYEPLIPATILKVVGIDLTSIGRFMPQSPDEDVFVLEDLEEHHYGKLVVADGRIVGTILLGYPLLAPIVSAAIKQQVDVSPCLDALRAGNWDVLRRVTSTTSIAAAPPRQAQAVAEST
jgi:NAD(P)H-nitrite reductase large subunit